jgi:hypothetical protein
MNPMPSDKTLSYRDRLLKLLLIVACLIFVGQLAASVLWRQYLDTPLLNYVGFLVNEQNLVPYSQIFETSMPGTLLFHSISGRILGYSDASVRFLDISLLLLAIWLIYLILEGFKTTQRLTAAVSFGLLYLSFGARMALQRDFIGTLPIAFAIVVIFHSRFKQIGQTGKLFIVGFLAGISSSFKPHLVIVLPFLVYFCISKNRAFSFKFLFKHLAISAIGWLISFSLPLFWVWHLGGLNSFIEMFFNYLPLHTQIGHDFTLIKWPEKLWYSISGLLLLNDHLIMLLLAILGYVFHFKRNPENRPEVFNLLALITAVLFFYPAISGQFWYYHWVPFLFFACIGASFLVSDQLCETEKKADNQLFEVIPVAVFFLLFSLQTGISEEFKQQLSGRTPDAPLGGVADQIGSYLQKNLKPGEVVQSLDWVNGAIHGMLIAKAVTATPFLYDYHFYHHISHPFINELRHRFMKELRQSPPDYFIYVFLKSRVSGPDTTQEFKDLGIFLFSNYDQVLSNNRFAIFRKKR